MQRQRERERVSQSDKQSDKQSVRQSVSQSVQPSLQITSADSKESQVEWKVCCFEVAATGGCSNQAVAECARDIVFAF